MKIITGLLNPGINENLKKDFEIIGKDILYTDDILEVINKNNEIDFFIINEKLPGQKNIYEIIKEINKKFPKIKIILFSKKIDKNIKVFKIINREVSLEIIKKVLKNEKIEEIKKCNIIGIFGSGGSGKTVFSTNLGLYFNKLKQKTLIINSEKDLIIKKKYEYLEVINFKKIILENYIDNYENIIIDNPKNYLKNKCKHKIILIEPNINEINKAKKIIKKDFYIILNKNNLLSIDENIVKKLFKDNKIIGKFKYSNKYNLLINLKNKEIIDEKILKNIVKEINNEFKFEFRK